MTNRDLLLRDGHLVFPSVIPADLCQRAADILNATPEPCFVWADAVAAEYRMWAHAFLDAQGLAFHGWESDIHIFNRRPGMDRQFWHDDDQRNHPFYQQGPETSDRRVFACAYFTSTSNGRAPLRVIPKSHHGGYRDFRIRFTTMRLQMSRIRPPGATEDYKGDIFADYPDIWGNHPDETLLEVPAGSVIVCDERILHGTSINGDTERRPMALWWLEKHPEDKPREAEFARAAGL